MGFFNIMQGNKHGLTLLKNESDDGVIVWKHDVEDFNSKSRLFLNPGESAIFVYVDKESNTKHEVVKEGKELKTDNYPFIRNITNFVYGGDSPFHCKLYFVRTSLLNRNNLWGTDHQIGPFEDVTHYTFKIAAKGDYDYTITDPGKLLNDVLGYGHTVVMQDEISNSLKGKIGMAVTNLLAKFFRHPEMKASVERVLQSLVEDMSIAVTDILNEQYCDDWGITIKNFTMGLEMCVDELPDDMLETNRQMRQYRAAQALGPFYDKEQIYRMMHESATTEGNPMGNMVGIGAGVGIGTGIGGSIGGQIKDMMDGIRLSPGNPAPTPIGGMGNHPDANGWGGEPTVVDPEEEKQKKRQARKERLEELREYYENGDITLEEYSEIKKQILSEI